MRAAVDFLEPWNYEAAIAAYRDILETYRFETEARHLLATVYRRADRLEDAVPVLQELIRMEPENSDGWSMLGASYLMLGQYPQAAMAYERFAEMEPDQAESHKCVGDVYRAQGQLALAAEKYSKALELDPRYPPAIFAMALTDLFDGRPEAARRGFESVADDSGFSPRHRAAAAIYLASYFRLRGQISRSLDVLERYGGVLTEGVHREAQGLSLRALGQMDLGNLGRARASAELAIEKSTVVPTRHLFVRGLVELESGTLDNLEATITRLRQDEESPGTVGHKIEKAAEYLGGLRFLAIGAPERAIAAFRIASSLEGYEYKIYRLGLARAYQAVGRSSEALALTREIVNEKYYYGGRLDLELERLRAHLVLAEILDALGQKAEATAQARSFLEAWSEADPGLEDLKRARRLAGGPAGVGATEP